LCTDLKALRSAEFASRSRRGYRREREREHLVSIVGTLPGIERVRIEPLG
jgi:hypothetical protein